MLDREGFDLWADGYDKTVGLSDEEGSYPFAGYRQILNEIYNRVLTGRGRSVLDIGFGTGILTTRLYQQGCEIWGRDFSQRMTRLAGEKTPSAGRTEDSVSERAAPSVKGRRLHLYRGCSIYDPVRAGGPEADDWGRMGWGRNLFCGGRNGGSIPADEI